MKTEHVLEIVSYDIAGAQFWRKPYKGCDYIFKVTFVPELSPRYYELEERSDGGRVAFSLSMACKGSGQSVSSRLTEQQIKKVKQMDIYRMFEPMLTRCCTKKGESNGD